MVPATTLVVTRPADDAGSLVAALRVRGRDVVSLPVIGIEAVDDRSSLRRTMRRIEDYGLAIFVSPNAIRHALAERTAPWPPGTTIGVMGPGSVETLARLGIAPPGYRVVSPARSDGLADRFDSEALFDALGAAIGLQADYAGRVLIVRGNGGRGWFATRLRDLGIAVDEVEAYRRTRPDADPFAAQRLTSLCTEGAAPTFVVTSSEGLGNLVAIVEDALMREGGVRPARTRAWLLGCPILAPHLRIVEKAQQLGFSHVALCAPGDRGILAAIE